MPVVVLIPFKVPADAVDESQIVWSCCLPTYFPGKFTRACYNVLVAMAGVISAISQTVAVLKISISTTAIDSQQLAKGNQIT